MAEVPIAAPAVSIREEVVPSRKRVKLPPWLEIAKPRLIPLLLATTLGGMALSESWPLPSPRLACTLGGGALAAAAAGVGWWPPPSDGGKSWRSLWVRRTRKEHPNQCLRWCSP